MTWIFLHWVICNVLIGGLLLCVGALLAARSASPVRRLRILEFTLLAALSAPLLASVQMPWQWSLKWLPATAETVPETETGTGETGGFIANHPPIEFPAAAPSPVTGGNSFTGSDAAVASASAGSHETGIAGAFFALDTISKTVVVLLIIQLIAVASIGTWWLIGVAALFRIWRRSEPLGADLLQQFGSLRRTLDEQRVAVHVSGQVSTALAFGLFRRRILLPQDLIDRGEEHIRFAVAHEYAHLTRGDLWTWRLTRFAQFCCWFQPAYWWLRRQIRVNQDFLADAAAAETGSSIDFAEFLVTRASRRPAWSAAVALPLSSRPSDLNRRVTMLLKSEHPLETRCPRALHAIGIATVAMALMLAAFVRLEAEEPGSDSAKQKPATVLAQKDPAQTDEKSEKGEKLTYKCRVLTKGTGKPIAGATVRVKRSLYGDPRYEINHPLETTTHTTDGDGYYTVEIPPEQSSERYLYIELDVEHPEHMAKRGFGYALSMIRKNERLGERPFFETTELYPAKAVTGRLLTPEGKPAKNVSITGYQHPGERPWNATDGHTGSFFQERTDENGKFSLPIVTPGKAAFWFQPSNAAPKGMVAPKDRGDIGDVTLKSGFAVKGQVLDADGKPVAGVKVSAQRASSESEEIDQFNRTSAAAGGYARSATTNQAGEFELAPIEAGSYEFRIAEYAVAQGTADFAGVFTFPTIDIKENSEPLKFQALPTVDITVKNVDAADKPKRGFAFTAWGRLPGGQGWFAQNSTRPKSGVCVAHIPRGLENVELSFSDNEHGSFRVRRKEGAELEAVRRIKLGTVEEDVSGIEVVRYKAPVLLVKAVDSDGKVVEDVKVNAQAAGVIDFEDSYRTDTNFRFEKQQDGRWRSSQLLPDVKIRVSVSKAGWKTEPQEISLEEGAEQELEFVLQKE